MVGLAQSVTGMALFIEDDNIQNLQSSYRETKYLSNYIGRSVPVRQYHRSCRRFVRYVDKLIVNGILVCKSPDPLIVVPFEILVDLIIVLHCKFAHIGRDKVLALVNTLVWHPQRYQVANEVCTTCPTCQINKYHPCVFVPPMLKICTSYPFELVAADLLSLPQTSQGHVGCLVLVDHHSKWVSVIPIRNKQAQTIVKALKLAIPYMLSVPTRLLTDNGPEFTAAAFEGFLNTMGIEHQLTTPYHPTSNGAVERVNSTIQGLLRNLQTEGSSWDETLPQAIISYNNSIHSQLQMSPSKFLLSHSHNSNYPFLKTNELQEKWKVGHQKFQPLRVGQYVLKRIPVTDHLTMNKLSPKFKGPYRISKVNPNNITYLLIEPHTDHMIRAHHTDLYAYKMPPVYLQKHPWFQEVCSEWGGKEVEMSGGPLGRVMYSSGSDLDSDSESVSGQMASLAGEADMCEVSESEDGSCDCTREPESRNKSILKPKCRCCQYEKYLEKQGQLCDNSTEVSGGVARGRPVESIECACQ